MGALVAYGADVLGEARMMLSGSVSRFAAKIRKNAHAHRVGAPGRRDENKRAISQSASQKMPRSRAGRRRGQGAKLSLC
jgi:hypothetical protein